MEDNLFVKTEKLYAIKGLTCNNCVAKVQLVLAPYAEAVKVTINPPQVSLLEQKADIKTLNALLKKAGAYEIGEQVFTTPTTTKLLLVSPILEPEFSESSAIAPYSYKPLILVFAYILLVTLAVEYTHGDFILHRFMPNFMAGFFLVFSFFKLLDLAGFASSYAMYDLLAKRVYHYGFIYPFIEFGLGVAYLININPLFVNAITLIVMAFSSIGVILVVMNKQKIRCACLGTGFNLPMTTVTIIEDLLMAAMAAWMLI